MKTKPMFDGFTSITFDELGLRVHVSRKHRTAGLFFLTGESVGALLRRESGGQLEYESLNGRSCPVEVFYIIATMI